MKKNEIIRQPIDRVKTAVKFPQFSVSINLKLGHENFAKFLIDNNRAIINARTEWGETPLFLSIQNGKDG